MFALIHEFDFHPPTRPTLSVVGEIEVTDQMLTKSFMKTASRLCMFSPEGDKKLRSIISSNHLSISPGFSLKDK